MDAVGTFGTGPFSSDGALDFLDALAERSADRWPGTLDHVFNYVLDNPSLIMKEWFPDEIVAAAALVAVTLDGNEFVADLALVSSNTRLDPSLLYPMPDLAALAYEALEAVAGDHGPWHQNWVDQSLSREATDTTNKLFAVLRGAPPQAAV